MSVTIEQLQAVLDHETAFTKPYGFVVASIAEGSCTLEVPYRPQFDRPDGGCAQTGAQDRVRNGRMRIEPRRPASPLSYVMRTG
jgi:hypothetical protein